MSTGSVCQLRVGVHSTLVSVAHPRSGPAEQPSILAPTSEERSAVDVLRGSSRTAAGRTAPCSPRSRPTAAPAVSAANAVVGSPSAAFATPSGPYAVALTGRASGSVGSATPGAVPTVSAIAS